MRRLFLLILFFGSLPALLLGQGPYPGDIAPDAVYIDMDKWYPFSEGLAAIKKGEKWAFIDTTGKIVIPWGKVEPVDPAPAFSQGRIIVKVGQGMGVADGRGNLLTTKAYRYVSNYNENPSGQRVCLAIYHVNHEPHYSILDHRGKEISVAKRSQLESTPETQVVFSSSNINKDDCQVLLKEDRIEAAKIIDREFRSGFADSKGQLVIPFQFVHANEFSEGLAAVSKKNEFGEEMWGFIDRAGNTVIDFKFSKEPGDFHQGLAVVYPRNAKDAGFRFAYTDFSGQVVFRVSPEHPLGVNFKGSDFLNSHLLILRDNNYYLIDQAGNATLWVENHRVQFDKEDELRLNIYDQTPFLTTHLVSFQANHPYQGCGALNQQAEVVIPPLFTKILSFTFCRAKATHKIHPKRTGYIDERGVFVIVKKEESQW
jgi:hypothetical protein